MKKVALIGAVALALSATIGLGIAIGRRVNVVAVSPSIPVSPSEHHHRRSPSPSPSASLGPSSSPTPEPGPVVTSSGSELTEVHGALRTFGSGIPCSALENPGFTARCGSVSMAGGRAIWVAEYKVSAGLATPSWFVHVYAYDPARLGWSEALRASDPSSVRWAQVTVLTSDLTPDAHPDIVIGFRYQGSGAALGTNVLTWPAGGSLAVAAHPDVAAQGSVRIVGGRLYQYSAQFPGGAPSCCPPYFQRLEIGWEANAFRVMSQARVKPEAVPSSQL